MRAAAVRAARSDRGAASAELVVAAPLLLLLLLAIVQFAVAEHAQHLAQAVADRALAVACAQDSTAQAGQAEAEGQLAVLAGPSLQHPKVTVTRTATGADVEISGEAAAVFPGLHLRVDAHTSGHIERFTTPQPGN
ncbi:TadE/TadG family type IV pilus assembly protein [Streptacidiphilus sp. MAP12-16]|uniref:TadE/TadG family type IV pilus assembly protein n=1 Tax=Streptacidiphilus sp. MAP12-16 TaxID=3156300 RepID=UPI0035117215